MFLPLDIKVWMTILVEFHHDKLNAIQKYIFFNINYCKSYAFQSYLFHLRAVMHNYFLCTLVKIFTLYYMLREKK